jgi:hypothetical protein
MRCIYLINDTLLFKQIAAFYEAHRLCALKARTAALLAEQSVYSSYTWFSEQLAWFSEQLAWFSEQLAWFSEQLAWFSEQFVYSSYTRWIPLTHDESITPGAAAPGAPTGLLDV